MNQAAEAREDSSLQQRVAARTPSGYSRSLSASRESSRLRCDVDPCTLDSGPEGGTACPWVAGDALCARALIVGHRCEPAMRAGHAGRPCVECVHTQCPHVSVSEGVWWSTLASVVARRSTTSFDHVERRVGASASTAESTSRVRPLVPPRRAALSCHQRVPPLFGRRLRSAASEAPPPERRLRRWLDSGSRAA